MRRGRWFLALIAALSVAAACSDEPTRSADAGTVTLRLTTPNTDDGAVLFEVTGPPIDGATPATASLQLFTRRDGDSTLVGVVAGGITNGAVVELQVSAGAAATDYTTRVIEVADRQNTLRASLAGYVLTAER